MKIDRFFPDQNPHVRFLLGLYINRKRREAGVSILDIASKVAISPQNIKRIESGRMRITSVLFDKIQSVLGLDPDDLNEIRKIASVAYINEISKAFASDYPV